MREHQRARQKPRPRRPRPVRLTPEEAAATLTDIGRRAIALAREGAILRRNLEAARTLGREAHAVSRLDGMAKVFDMVVDAWSSGEIRAADDEEQFHPSALSTAWRGIGEWEP
jgi:hypothetical protein